MLWCTLKQCKKSQIYQKRKGTRKRGQEGGKGRRGKEGKKIEGDDIDSKVEFRWHKVYYSQ